MCPMWLKKIMLPKNFFYQISLKFNRIFSYMTGYAQKRPFDIFGVFF